MTKVLQSAIAVHCICNRTNPGRQIKSVATNEETEATHLENHGDTPTISLAWSINLPCSGVMTKKIRVC